MTVELAVREGRLDDARAAAARGLPLVEGTEEGARLVKLVWAALMVEAEDAEREAFVAAGDHAAAAEPLAAVLAAAAQMEAAPLAEAAGALARRARVRIEADAPAPEPAPAAPLGLTPREHEVLLLVAEGRTNREIGEQLYMSEKTASVHVSRILAKLDVSGQVEAASVAHRLGLTPR